MMIISENDLYVLSRPLNTWDTNYHLLEIATGKDFLIDVDDVADNEDQMIENDLGLMWDDLANLNVPELIDNSWKTLEKEGN